MPRLDNASISIKSLFAPMVSAVIILGILGLFYSTYTALKRTNDVRAAVTQATAQARSAMIDLTRGHAELYRAASLKSQGAEVAIIHKVRTEAMAAAASAAATAHALTSGGNGLDAGQLKAAADAIDAYIAAAKQSADVVEQDAFTATMFMTDAEEKFTVAQKQLASLIKDLSALRGGTERDMLSTLDGALYRIGGAAAAAIILSVLIAIFFARLISRPIVAMTDAMRRLASGDLSVDLPAADRRDELGAMAEALAIFRDNAREVQHLAAEQRTEQGRKEQRQQAIEGYINEFDRSVREAVEALASAATEMRATAGSMSATAEETQRQAGAVASASEQTSANVQTVAASAEEMTSSISEIARQVTQASDIAKRAVADAQRTNGTVNTLAEAAQKIGQVVQLIQDIASQTNLLALNATIEAARAGEAGKGFAVVASEVKSLATQTAKATEDIAAQIGSIQSVTGEAVTAIQGIGGTIGHINEISTAIASAVEEQGAATQEIARNTQQAAKGTEQVSSNIAGVNRAAGETGAAAAQVLSSAEALGRQSETLRTSVNRFLEKIRAA
jgi:methyl-accepting chemotaxis protein